MSELLLDADRDTLHDHEWHGGYYCKCGHEINSPYGYTEHLIETLEKILAKNQVALEYKIGWEIHDMPLPGVAPTYNIRIAIAQHVLHRSKNKTNTYQESDNHDAEPEH